MMRCSRFAAGAIGLLLGTSSTAAQDLDPRAYARVPVGFTVAIAGLSLSSGGVLTDPTLPVEHVHAEVWTPSVGFAQSFSLFGKTAQTLVALPFSSARVTGAVAEQAQHIDRAGLSDVTSPTLRAAGRRSSHDAAAGRNVSAPAHYRHERDRFRTHWSGTIPGI